MTDFTLDARDVVLQLINYDNGTAILRSQIVFDPPVVVDPEITSRNTQLVIKAIPGKGYKGQQTHFYDRVPLSDFLDGNELILIKGPTISLSGLIPEINRRLKINLTSEDYFDFELPDFQNPYETPVDLEVFAKPLSYVYQDSFIFSLKPGQMYLQDVISTLSLSGLTIGYNYTSTTLGIMLEQLNIDNPNRLISEENVVSSLPIVTDPQLFGRNTEVTLSAIVDSGYLGEVLIRYDRINLGEYGVDEVPIIPLPEGLSLEKILIEFNTLYGSKLTVDDIADDVVIPAYVPVGGIDIILKAHQNSYVYYGQVVIHVDATHLSALFSVKSLGAFTIKPMTIQQMIKRRTLDGFFYPSNVRKPE